MRGGSYNTYSTAWLSSHPPEHVVISAIVCKTMGQEIVFLYFRVFRICIKAGHWPIRKGNIWSSTKLKYVISGSSKSMLQAHSEISPNMKMILSCVRSSVTDSGFDVWIY